MITNAKNWATSRGLTRKNEVHGADEFKLPTDEEFEFMNHRRRETEGTGSFEVEDPDGTLLNSSDLSAEQAMMVKLLVDQRAKYKTILDDLEQSLKASKPKAAPKQASKAKAAPKASAKASASASTPKVKKVVKKKRAAPKESEDKNGIASTQGLLGWQLERGQEAIALVEGCVGVDEPSEGAIEVPLLPWQDAQGRDVGSISCAKDGLAACTSYKVLDRFHVPNSGPVSFWPRSRWFSLLQIACHSDRICQVYAHMAFIGHPVVCEQKYNAMNFEEPCSCDLAPDLQVALLRLQSLALDTKVCQTWTSRLPGLPLLLSCRGSLPPEPEGPDQKLRSETSKQTSRCSCCGDLEEAQCCSVVSPEGRRALHWTLRRAKSQTEEVAWESELCRPWAFGVRGWIPFELRGSRWDEWCPRAAPGGLSGETLPTWWKRHGIRWNWAHDGSRVKLGAILGTNRDENGWIELNDKGSLMSKWGTGFWQTVNGDEEGHFLVVGINNMSHLLYLKEEVFEVLVKRPTNVAEDWKVLQDVEPCCATRGWPLFLAKNKLQNFLLAYVCLVAGSSLIMTLYFGDIFQQFSSLQESFFTLLLYSFGNTERALHGSQPFIETGSSHLHAALFFYTVFVVTIILNMFTTIVIDAFAAEGDPERYEKIYKEEIKSLTTQLLQIFGKGHLLNKKSQLSRQASSEEDKAET
eukprot:s686_g16.t1